MMFNTYFKILLATILFIVAFQTFRFMFSTSYYLSARTSLEAFRAGTWSCELDRRLVINLRTEIREKDKLLKYREKVINSLRKRIALLNTTVSGEKEGDSTKNGIQNRKHSLEFSEEVTLKRGRIRRNSTEKEMTAGGNPTPIPQDLEKVINNGKKPCCVALKRMSDLLRRYIDSVTDLKQQVASYEQTNITAKLVRYGEVVRKQTVAKKCSTHFLPTKVDKQKDELYLASDIDHVYEAIPLYMSPKQRIGNFGAKHRNVDLRNALDWVVSEFDGRWREKNEKAQRVVDVLFQADPLQGNKYIFTLQSSSGRMFKYRVLRPLGPYISEGRIVEQTMRTKELIDIIVPLSGRPAALKGFLKMFQHVCIKNKENVFLTLIMYGNTTSTKELKDIVYRFTRATGFTAFDILRRNEPFSRGRALDDGVKRWNGRNDVLLFFCDVDVTFGTDFLRRCRTNTEVTKLVYYPILFSQYNPSMSGRNTFELHSVEIDAESGTWRPLGFGMVCMYQSDYLKVGGFNLDIKGWGGEDNDLFNR